MAAPQPTPARKLAPHEGRVLSAQEVMRGADGALHLAAMQCADCGTRVFPPSDTCPTCLGAAVGPLPVQGAGTLYSYTTVHIAPPQWETPYVLGYVDFPEGVRVFGKVKAQPAQLKTDMPVTVELAEVAVPEQGATAYRYCFVPA